MLLSSSRTTHFELHVLLFPFGAARENVSPSVEIRSRNDRIRGCRSSFPLQFSRCGRIEGLIVSALEHSCRVLRRNRCAPSEAIPWNGVLGAEFEKLLQHFGRKLIMLPNA